MREGFNTIEGGGRGGMIRVALVEEEIFGGSEG